MTKQERIQPETCWECDVFSLVISLFYKSMRRPIRLRTMTLSMSGLTGYAEQASLFETRSLEAQRQQDRAKKLAVALDTIHARYGKQSIHYGRSV